MIRIVFFAIFSIGFCNNIFGFDFNIGHVAPTYNHVTEKNRKEQERERRLASSNVFTDHDYNKILEEKIKDLKSINAILTRFKEDFRKVREQDDQDGRFTKDKVNEIFKTNIWQYTPTKNLRILVNHLHHDYYYHDMSREDKLFQLRNKITTLKNQLIYLRDLSARKNRTPWQIFIYLYHTDIRLAVHKHNKEWREYQAVLKELDQGLN